jgi:hypothetical protein
LQRQADKQLHKTGGGANDALSRLADDRAMRQVACKNLTICRSLIERTSTWSRRLVAG